jgi:hypothetical protein
LAQANAEVSLLGMGRTENMLLKSTVVQSTVDVERPLGVIDARRPASRPRPRRANRPPEIDT